MEWLRDQRMKQTVTSTYGSQANGIAERCNNLIKTKATVVFVSKYLHTSSWWWYVHGQLSHPKALHGPIGVEPCLRKRDTRLGIQSPCSRLKINSENVLATVRDVSWTNRLRPRTKFPESGGKSCPWWLYRQLDATRGHSSEILESGPPLNPHVSRWIAHVLLVCTAQFEHGGTQIGRGRPRCISSGWESFWCGNHKAS